MKPIVIAGPTAVGKTEIAIKIAEKINGEIISADSMQIYKGMDVGTAKPTKEEQQKIKHHLIDIKNPDESFSAGEFVKTTLRLIDELNKKGKYPIIVGGTGFYLDALINGLDSVEPVGEKIKTFFDDICEELGSFYLYEWLEVIDEDWAKKVSSTDCQRIKRGLSFFVDKGVPLSSLFTDPKSSQNDYLVFILYASKEYLKKRIEKRTEKMLKSGLIEEVKGLLQKGYADTDPMKAIGYKETIMFLQGKIDSKEKLKQEIVKNTLTLVKRQMTFFKSRFRSAIWVDVEKEKPLEKILNASSGHLS